MFTSEKKAAAVVLYRPQLKGLLIDLMFRLRSETDGLVTRRSWNQSVKLGTTILGLFHLLHNILYRYAYTAECIPTFFSTLIIIIIWILSVFISSGFCPPDRFRDEHRRPTACRCRISIYIYNTHNIYRYLLFTIGSCLQCVRTQYTHHTTRQCRYDNIILFMCSSVKRHALGVPSFCTIECRDNAPWKTDEDIVATQIWKNILYRQNVLNIYTRAKYYYNGVGIHRDYTPAGTPSLRRRRFIYFRFPALCTCKSFIIRRYPIYEYITFTTNN